MHPRALALASASACLLVWRSAASATDVSGGSIAADTTWTASASPYVVHGDVTVALGARLTLEPGVEVQIESGDALAAGTDTQRVELIIAGAFVARGSAAAPVRIHAPKNPGANAWYGFIVQGTATLASFDNVAIEDANNALTSAATGGVLELSHSALSHNVAALWLTAGAPRLHELQLFENSAYGVFALGNAQAIDFSLTNSVLRNNGSYGVYALAAAGQSVHAALQNCTIYGNDSAGVTVRASGAGSAATLTMRNDLVISNGILGLDASATDGALASIALTYSDVWSNGQDFAGVEPGAGCLAEDALFVAAPTDLRLSGDSACVDSGSEVEAPESDLLGRARPNGAGVDLGAYEFYEAASDAGAAGATGATADADTGCGCRLARSRSTSIWPWVGLALVGLYRRRLRA